MRDSSRKQLVVDPVVQGVFVRRFLLCWASSTILVSFLLTAVYTFAEPDQRILEHFGAVIVRHWPFLGMSVAMLPIIVWEAVRLSRRIAGPVCRIRQSLRRHAEGEKIRPLQFRGNDLWKDLGDQINILLNRLQEVEARAAAERSSRRNDRMIVHDPQRRDEPQQYPTGSRRKTVSRGLFRVLAPPTGAVSSEPSCSS